MRVPLVFLQFVDRHIINRMIVKCEIPEQGTYGIASRQGDLTVFTYDTRNQLLVNDLINVDSPDNMAVNGVLHKVADVLKCSCELGVTMSTRYQHRTSSRRHFHRLRY